MTLRLVRAICAAAVTALAAAGAAAHGAQPRPTAVTASAAASDLAGQAQPLVARYSVRVRSPGHARPTRQEWHLSRESQRVVMIKGSVEEHWLRDEAGQIRFERVLHDQASVLEYSPGELATLEIQPDWDALSRLIDPRELQALRVVRRIGSGATRCIDLVGRAGATMMSVRWSLSLQLPLWIERRGPGRYWARLGLVQHAAVAPAGWPQPGARSQDYARIDAADFGDMPYVDAVRVAEALDVRAGWRAQHGHD